MERPAEMDAVLFDGFGGPEVLTLRRMPVPRPGEGEILVAVAAAGVNRPDVMQRLGKYPPPPGAPEGPGLEISGRVAEAGPGASRFREGDAVMALVPGGGYADYAVVAEANALPVPAGLSMVEAAGVPETFFTVWSNVFQRGGLTAGETFLVHGGTSGIGVAAIQLGRAFGAMVYATAGSPEKCRAAEALGAAYCADYRREDFVETIGRAAGGRGIDLILDMVGGDYLMRNVRLAAEDGRIVQIATQQGAKAEIDLFQTMRKRLTITGSTLRNRPVAFKGKLAAEIERHVLPLLSEGRVRVPVESTYPLREAARAHAHMDKDHVGKIVLLCAGHEG